MPKITLPIYPAILKKSGWRKAETIFNQAKLFHPISKKTFKEHYDKVSKEMGECEQSYAQLSKLVLSAGFQASSSKLDSKAQLVVTDASTKLNDLLKALRTAGQKWGDKNSLLAPKIQQQLLDYILTTSTAVQLVALKVDKM